MNEFQVFSLVVSQLTAAFAEQGKTVPVAQSYQLQNEGRQDNTVYFYSVVTPALGWQGRRYRVDLSRNELIRDERQVYAMFLQIFALWDDGHQDMAASDVVAMARQLVASSRFTAALAKQGVFVERPTDVRNPFFTNDRDQQEASPSFDVTLSFTRTIEQVSPAVDRVEFNMNRI